MKVDTSKPFGVELDHDDVRILCEAAVKARLLLTEQELKLVNDICYYMIWDDLLELLGAL